MKLEPLLIPLNKRRIPQAVGNKALNLHRLVDIGLRIPETYFIPWDAYLRFTQADVNLLGELRSTLQNHIDPNKTYAVRSSANIEDDIERSFAGQFDSVLDVQGVDDVLKAIQVVWESGRSPRVSAYLEQHDFDADELMMGVILQEMVQSVFAGVALSRNPVTGADEVVVEAVEGSGEALVQSGVTPSRWINKWGTWIGEPAKDQIPLSLIEEVVEETRRIARTLDSFVDLEWVFDGVDIYWLQVREITTLNRHNVYSNHISREFIPGMVKPLVGSINLPLVCSMWLRMLTEMVGRTSVKPEDLAKSFYYRVYFNMGTLGQIFKEIGMPSDSVEVLMGHVPEDADKPKMKPTFKTFLRFPWLLGFVVDKWFFARRMRKALPRIIQNFKSFDYSQAMTLDESQLLMEIDRLYACVQDAAYYNIVTPLIAMLYSRILQKQLENLEVDLRQFDQMAGVEELLDFDPNAHLHDLHMEYLQLEEDLRSKINAVDYAGFKKLPGLQGFQEKIENFLERFGHLSDSGNDFSYTPWRETPDIVLDMIKNFQPKEEDVRRKTQFSDLKLSGFKRFLIGLFYHRARDFHLLREQISSYYTYGYGLFRYYYQALGFHLIDRGILDDPEDIYYLEDVETRQLLGDEGTRLNPRQVVTQHKEDIERFKNITLPGIIYGDEAPPVTDPSMEKLIGVPTSIGHYTGRATLVRGIQDFNKVKQGDVLVIPYSEVSWTPLFTKAGGVVAESGGILSHSSIVAREYNIPAVVSVHGAMSLPDNTLITVNGHTGEVILHEESEGDFSKVSF